MPPKPKDDRTDRDDDRKPAAPAIEVSDLVEADGTLSLRVRYDLYRGRKRADPDAYGLPAIKEAVRGPATEAGFDPDGIATVGEPFQSGITHESRVVVLHERLPAPDAPPAPTA